MLVPVCSQVEAPHPEEEAEKIRESRSLPWLWCGRTRVLPRGKPSLKTKSSIALFEEADLGQNTVKSEPMGMCQTMETLVDSD